MTKTAPAGWYPDPENPAQQRYWDGATWTQNVAPLSPSDDASPHGTAQPAADAPVLRTWKTSVGFSVLGVLFGTPLLMILALPIAILPMMLFAVLTGLSDPQSFSPILALVGNALMLGYAVKIYPSYFSEKPRIKSSKLISFANFVFGGLIFGLLWNGNLTKKTKGISYKVQAWLSGLMCLWLALGIVVALFFGVTSNSTGTPSDSQSSRIPPTIEKTVQPLERAEGARTYTDEDTGASFVIPSTWTELPLSKERKFIDTKFSGDGATAMYGSVDVWSVLTEDDKSGKTRADFDSMEDLEGDFSEILGYSGPDGSAQSIVLNGVEYFVLSLPVTSSGVDLQSVQVVRVEKGRWYQFQYYTPAVSAAGGEDAGLETFYSMLASMVYP